MDLVSDCDCEMVVSFNRCVLQMRINRQKKTMLHQRERERERKREKNKGMSKRLRFNGF